MSYRAATVQKNNSKRSRAGEANTDLQHITLVVTLLAIIAAMYGNRKNKLDHVAETHATHREAIAELKSRG
jgi:hypothetical protein